MIDEPSDAKFSYADYLDELRVQISLVSYPDQPADEVWRFLVDTPPPIALDQILDGLVEDLRGDQAHPPPFAADVRRTSFSWGASASAAEIAVQVGIFLTGVVAEAVRERIRHRLNRTVNEAGDRMAPTWEPYVASPPADLEEAVNRAKWHAIAAYKLKPDVELTLVEDEHGQDGWRIALHEPDRTVYEVWLVESDGLVSVARIRRRQPEDGNTARE